MAKQDLRATTIWQLLIIVILSSNEHGKKNALHRVFKEVDEKMVRNCSNCGQEVPKGNAYCSACGQQQNEQVLQPVHIKKHCSNCGKEVENDEMYCVLCGQRQEWQMSQPIVLPYNTQQPPMSVKKKSKIPLIIAGILVLVVTLVTTGIFTNGFGLFGGTKGGVSSGDNDIINIKIPANASEEEKLVYNYIEYSTSYYEGAVAIQYIYPYCADSFYSMAAVNVCAIRYAVDCLLEIKGVPPAEDGRLRDWDEIATLGWRSPFPWFFEGVVLEARGDTARASECYRKAMLNPDYLKEDEGLKILINLDEKALNDLKVMLEGIEDKIYKATDHSPLMIAIERNEYNFDISYLRGMANEYMALHETDENDVSGAMDAYGYYLAALYNDPLDGDSYADLVEWWLRVCGNDETTTVYLDAGMSVDSTNTRLTSLAKEIKEAVE